MTLRVLVRGGGDLASGVAMRCHRAGWQVCITELEQPLAVRRTVSFSQAVYDGSINIEGVAGVRADGIDEVRAVILASSLPVLVDPDCMIIPEFQPHVHVDARMAKQTAYLPKDHEFYCIGLGPGFMVGENCDVIVETLRGHHLGRVLWNGQAAENTGTPDKVGPFQDERVIRAVTNGVIKAQAAIGDHIEANQIVAEVNGEKIISPISGVLRGLIQDGIYVPKGLKIGDVDPRDDPNLCRFISDKALAVGGGVLEAILSCPSLRNLLYAG